MNQLIRLYLRKVDQDLGRFDIYIASLYWSFQTLFSIGFGDIVSKNLCK
jgi:hypothetical protein